MTPLQRAKAGALKALQPPPRLRLSTWIESDMRLPAGVSALPGRVKLFSYQRGIADAISDPAIERVTLVKSVRVGFSTLLTGAVASYVANEPSPIMVLLPTESDARDYCVSDLDPVFEASPTLTGLLSEEADPDGRSTLTSRRFPGGSLKVVAAKSPRNLRRHNVRILLMDEVDGMEPTAEGSPLVLAERRTLSFPDRKIIIGSTPTVAETSNVLRAFAQSDQRVFEVPCPSCGAATEIMWEHIEWAPERPETAAFRCPHCQDLIPERLKPAMVDAGSWRITKPEVVGHAGFRINALVSCLANASWGKLAAEFLVVKDHTDQLRGFVNTILGQGWRDSVDAIEADELQARAEPFSLEDIPPDVLTVTLGCDVQDDRLECVLVGHSRDETFILGHIVIWGSPGEPETWVELDDLLRTTWPHPNGGRLKVDAAALDSGDGDWTERVYAFCRPRLSRKVLAIKGMAGARAPLQRSKSGAAPLWLVGVDSLKGQILTRLSRGRSIRFSNSLEPWWFEQLTSERRVMRYVAGRPVMRFERIPGRRAEALDAVVYALAARHVLTVNLDQRAEELATLAVITRERPTVIRSAWLEGP